MKEMKDKCPRRWKSDNTMKGRKGFKVNAPYSSNIGLNPDSKRGKKD